MPILSFYIVWYIIEIFGVFPKLYSFMKKEDIDISI